MLSSFLFTVFGAVLSVLLASAIELWQARGRRKLYGEWISAVQPVYYESLDWHIQKVCIRRSVFGIIIETLQEPGKLQWRFLARLRKNEFLVGSWKSLRAGSTSSGYMCAQISSNGRYMCGHDYGKLISNRSAHFGILLLARTMEDLDVAWHAMKKSSRPLLPLEHKIDFT